MQTRQAGWKRIGTFAVMLGLMALTTVHGAVVAYDDLEEATLGSLNGQTSGTGFAAGYALGGGAVCVVTNRSLGYDNGDVQCDGGTNCILVTYPSVTAAFTRAVNSQDGDDLYLSFLFETATADGGSNEDFFSLGFNNAVGETTAGVEHRYSSPSGDHAFGIRYGSSDAKGSIGTEANQTYFLVLRLRKLTPGASQSYDEIALFVNPSTMYEPEPTMVVTNARWAAATYLAARIASAETGDAYYVDNLCIGTAYSSVVYPLGDGPVTEPPVITPRSGAVLGALTVTLTSPTPGATVRYTTDGSTPSATHGTIYTEAFVLTDSARVQAIAISDGKNDSAVATTDYSIQYHWTGGASDLNWSTVANWSPSVSPVGMDVVFDNTATNRTAIGTNNIVDASMTISSLSYTNIGNGYHITQIGSGTTLTLDGSRAPANVFFLGKTATQSGQTFTRARMIGGGALAVNSPASDFLITKTSNNDLGTALLDAAGLSMFSATVSNFFVGLGSRTTSTLTLPSVGIGSNTIVAVVVAVGDGNGGSEQSGTSFLNLGPVNLLNADDIFLGATAYSTKNVQSGSMVFQSSVSDARLRMRGTAGGDARANLTVGSHGKNSTNRAITGSLDATRGYIDALLGTLILAEGRGTWASSGGKGRALGTFSMSDGWVDAQSVAVGRTLSGGGATADTVVGTLNVSNGVFQAGSLSMADNNSGSAQNVTGNLNIFGTGKVSVSGDLVLGTRNGTATGVVASVSLSGGALAVEGNMTPGSSSSDIVSEVLLRGGALVVTNSAETATLRIENGTFAISAGTATLDRLVTTNALATTQVTLAGTGSGDYGQVTVGTDVLLGGTLAVAFGGAYEPAGGEVWTIVGGTGSRTGTFAATDLPEGLKVVYTASGYQLAYPAAGTLLTIR